MKGRIAIVFAVGLLIAADAAPDEATKKEYQKFEGTWRIESLELQGQKMAGAFLKNSKIVLKGDRFLMTDGFATYGGKFKFDLSKSPKTMDMHFTDGPEKGKSVFGIYELEGDTYKLCLGLTGKPRPTAFVSKPGSGHALEILKRAKPDEAKDEKKDKEKVRGTWLIESHEANGQKTPADTIKGWKIVITETKYTFSAGDQTINGTYTIDESKKPKHIDAEAEGQGKFLGLYVLEGDTLKMCFGAPGGDRPKEMKTEADGGQQLFVFKKEK